MSGSRGNNKKAFIAILIIAICVILLLLILAVYLKNNKGNNKSTEIVDTGKDYIAFLDVGQGDGALIKSGESSAIIDTGTPEGAAEFVEKLKNMGVDNIETLLLTHNHDDHIGGAAAVSGAFKINNLLIPDISSTKSPTRIMGTVTNDVTASGGSCTTARSGLFYDIGNIKITVLCSFTQFSNENEHSIVSIVTMNGKRFLFTGDAGKQTENQMIKDGINLSCDVLKAGHHGSKGSSTAAFLSLAAPDYAVISCGKNNVYKHPNEEALTRLINCGATVLRTDILGDIIFYMDENALAYKTEK